MSEEEKRINEIKIHQYEKHLDYTKAAKRYAIQRIDILVIAIASFGVLFCIEVSKLEKEISEISFTNHWLLDAAMISFALTIIFNLCSQLSDYWLNRHEEDWTNENLYKLQNTGQFDECALKEADRMSGRYEKLFKTSNIIYRIALLAGIFFGLVFYIIEF